uniref:Caspase family protein n=1 Tax=Macrostomum lignano TaxID=282301 RepID=A0A1I8F9S3_9PLAT
APSSELAAYQLSDSTSQKSRTAIPLASLLRIEDNASLSASNIVLVASESVRRRQFSVLGNERRLRLAEALTALGAEPSKSNAVAVSLRLLDESLPFRSQLLAGLSDKSACSR